MSPVLQSILVAGVIFVVQGNTDLILTPNKIVKDRPTKVFFTGKNTKNNDPSNGEYYCTTDSTATNPCAGPLTCLDDRKLVELPPKSKLGLAALKLGAVKEYTVCFGDTKQTMTNKLTVIDHEDIITEISPKKISAYDYDKVITFTWEAWMDGDKVAFVPKSTPAADCSASTLTYYPLPSDKMVDFKDFELTEPGEYQICYEDANGNKKLQKKYKWYFDGRSFNDGHDNHNNNSGECYRRFGKHCNYAANDVRYGVGSVIVKMSNDIYHCWC
jgi:hypothetical protein